MRRRALWKLGCSCAVAGAVTIACSLPARAQQLGGGRSLEIPVVQILAGLALCSLVAFGVVAMLRVGKGRSAMPSLSFFRGTSTRVGERIRIIETQRLSPHADICRFVAGNREYVVIASPGGTTILRDIEIVDSASPPSLGQTK